MTDFMATTMAVRYARAVDADNSARWEYSRSPDRYFFDEGLPNGLDALQLLPESPESIPTVLDIGAGQGTYLQGVKRELRDGVKAIGFGAAANPAVAVDRIDWIAGDFLRPETWQPVELLPNDSIDLAVSRLTFMHFTDPLRGLVQAMRLLKADGHLVTDHITVKAERETIKATADIVREDLANYDTWGRVRVDIRRDSLGVPYIRLSRLLLRKMSDAPLFERLMSIASYGGRVAYAPATGS